MARHRCLHRAFLRRSGSITTNLPKIELSALPDLDTLTGVFGSMSDFSPMAVDDSVVIIMVFICELIPPPPPGVLF